MASVARQSENTSQRQAGESQFPYEFLANPCSQKTGRRFLTDPSFLIFSWCVLQGLNGRLAPQAWWAATAEKLQIFAASEKSADSKLATCVAAH